MASKIDIISQALILLGHDSINSLTDPGRVVRVAVSLYDQVKEEELTSSNWSFARFKVQLAQLTTAPIDEFTYAYQLPSDYLKAMFINPRARFKIYHDQVYTNAGGPMYLDYIASVGESRFSPSFTRMLSLSLAANYAIPIREGFTTSQLLEQRYNVARNRATQSDSSQQSQDKLVSNPFVSARYG